MSIVAGTAVPIITDPTTALPSTTIVPTTTAGNHRQPNNTLLNVYNFISSIM